ncbi:MAG: dynamin family protein [Actinomycetota bacterium]
MSGPPGLLEQVRALVASATEIYRGTPGEARLATVEDRLDEPLRVAIAGKVKAGKSTLLNALVGEELAPTSAQECTKVVTWYHDGNTYRVTLHPHRGPPRQVPFSRDGGAIEIELGATAAADIEKLDVEWPSASLRSMTLIDTPGIASLSTDISARTHAFLSPGEDEVTPADAVLYLMRHLHTTDIRLLETFHDEAVSRATPVNAIGILSRADEVAVGRLDAMESAAKISARYRGDPKVRRLCQTVLPLAGLLAQSGTTLREAEYRALASLAREAPANIEALLISADRFVGGSEVAGLTSEERGHLMDRFGLFGVRLAIDLIRRAVVGTAGQLAGELVKRSGLIELRQTLSSQFAARRDVLKARSALMALDGVLHDLPLQGTSQLAAEAERVTSGAHELSELSLLNAVRSGGVRLKPDEAEALERLLGAWGTSPAARLDLSSEADPGAIRIAIQGALARWQRRAENPLSSRTTAEAARVAVRTCEGLMLHLVSAT